MSVTFLTNEDKTVLEQSITQLSEEKAVNGYDIEMANLDTASVARENDVLRSALATLCNRRNSEVQNTQQVNLKNSGAQKLVLHLHKRENDGYDTDNDVFLPNALTDFSDVRITADNGNMLPYHVVYAGNIDIVSDSRMIKSVCEYQVDSQGAVYVAYNSHIHKSSDAGVTWEQVASIKMPVHRLTLIDSQDTMFFYYDGSLYRCPLPYTECVAVVDITEGGTYTGCNTLPDHMVEMPTGEILLGGYQVERKIRIWRSIDHGVTWTKVYQADDEKYQHVHHILLDTSQGAAILYAGLDRGGGNATSGADGYYLQGGGVLKSTDSGLTWVDIYADQDGKWQAADYGVIYADDSGNYRLLGGETPIVGGVSIIRTEDDETFYPVLEAGHSVYDVAKVNGLLIAGGCGAGSYKNAALYLSDDDGLTWKQIYTEEPILSNASSSDGIRAVVKMYAGTEREQLFCYNRCDRGENPNKRIFYDENSWYAEIIVDVPDGVTSLTIETGYMCPNYGEVANNAENKGEKVFSLPLNENGRYIKETVSGEIYDANLKFVDGGKHLGNIYPDIISAADEKAASLRSPYFDDGIKKTMSIDAANGVTISLWLTKQLGNGVYLIGDGENWVEIRRNALYISNLWINDLVSTLGRFEKIDIVVDNVNAVVKIYNNGILRISTEKGYANAAAIFCGEKEYTILKRRVLDDTAIQHFEILQGVPTDKDVYDSYFGGLTDNFYVSNDPVTPPPGTGGDDDVTVENLVPASIDTTGAIYNGTGYRDGFRLVANSTAHTVTEEAYAGMTVTGYMPMVDNDVIRINADAWAQVSPRYAIVFLYDGEFNPLAMYTYNGSASGLSGNTPNVLADNGPNAVTTENGVTTIALVPNAYSADLGKTRYFRFAAAGNGADMIVTINQDFTLD